MTTKTNINKRSVLIVDDDELIRETLVGMLCKDFNCHHVENGFKAIEHCKKHGHPDVILMDYHMPGFSGLQTCSKIRANNELKHIPIIFFTGMNDYELQRKCWIAGAADFVAKPVIAEELKMRVQHQIEVKERELYLENLACRDSLTSLYNRQFLEQRVPDIVRRLNSDNETLSVAMIDIDNFKKFNDTYGHLEGDNVLKEVAKTLSSVVRKREDYVLRFGGEEFIALLACTTQQEATRIAKKMTKAVERLLIKHKHSECGYVTISVGVTTSQPNDTIKLVELFKDADNALYRAKVEGKNTVVSNTDLN